MIKEFFSFSLRIYYSAFEFSVKRSIIDKPVTELTWEEIKELLFSFWSIMVEAFWVRFSEVAEFWRYYGGIQWFIPIALFLIYIIIKKKFFKTPDVNELFAKQDIRGLIKSLQFKRNETSVKVTSQESFKDSQAVKIRCTSALALAKLNDPVAIIPLIQALGDVDKYVRMNVVRAIACFKDPKVKQALNHVKDRDPDEFVRYLAEDLLGKVNKRITD